MTEFDEQIIARQNHEFVKSALQSGHAYGYPECCIKKFISQPSESLQNKSPTYFDKLRFQAAHMNGEYIGFIPCIRHAMLITSGQIKLENLIKNRRIDLEKFPNDWSLK